MHSQALPRRPKLIWMSLDAYKHKQISLWLNQPNTHPKMSSYTTKQIGSKYTTGFKTYILKDGKVVSPFHDIPLHQGSLVNCVNEIPRFEHGKFEISKEVSFNPIMQDVKKGKVRFVRNVYPTTGYPFNYGALPQTWEDPSVKDPHCDAYGDNDPVDVVEIGSRRKGLGEVYQGKILGALALLDENEADWKIIVIDANDPMADKVNGIEDVKKHFPGLLCFVYKWFRDYKCPDGKPKNEFAFDGEFLDADFASKVVGNAHESWRKLVISGYKDVAVDNCTCRESKCFKDSIEVVECPQEDAKVPEDLQVFFYIHDD